MDSFNFQLTDVCGVKSILKKKDGHLDFGTEISTHGENESKVLVLYTGGTIGMVRNAEGALTCLSHAFENKIRLNCSMHDEEYSHKRFKHLINQNKDLPLVLPHSNEVQRRVLYSIYEYDPLLDSSNMTMDDWIQIAKDIKDHYMAYDGFVILHGTDTMAFTASALSFMLEHLGKPVIVTGSQIPCFETRSDGRDNFLGALILAGNYSIPEVGVYFRHQLMRGNRTIKVSAANLDAFQSPNMQPLVQAGIDIKVDYRAIHKQTAIEKFCVHTKLNPNVVLVRIFPSMRTETIAYFLQPPIEGVVLQCYGAGNVPNNRKDIMNHLKEATDRGVIILSVTQCINGSVSGLYATGKALLDIGIIPGNDLTPEAALTKLCYVLSKDEWDLNMRRKMIQTNLAGEMTVLDIQKRYSNSKSILEHVQEGGRGEEQDLIMAIAQQLKVKTSEEMDAIKDVLFPSILCAAVYTGQTSKLEELKSMYDADMSVTDYDGRAPIHVAASEGNVEMVEYLMKSGASVHARDRNHDTPLLCAIKACHRDVIRSLVACGSHLQMGGLELAEELCYLSRLGLKKKLSCYKLAGANLNSMGFSKQTALHAAVETGQIGVVRYLLEQNVDTAIKDIYDRTALDIAQVLHREEIVTLLENSLMR